MRTRLALLSALAMLVAVACREPEPPGPLARVVTLAGDGPHVPASGLSDPFGVAVGADGTIYATDGTGGRIFRIAADGIVAPLAEGLDMPSALALLPDGALAVANTGAGTIVRVDATTGAVTTLAGTEAGLDAPVGVAVAPDGTIYVADTYNDRIVAIAPGGAVRTVVAEGAGLDTPCGVAVAPDGALVVADTGNGLVRLVAPDGSLAIIGSQNSFVEPTAIAFGADGSVWVADAGDACVWLCELGSSTRLAGDGLLGRADGPLGDARFGRVTGVAGAPDGSLVVADSTNGVVRAVVPVRYERGRVVGDLSAARLDPAELRAAVPPRWPYDPPDRPREIAATFGEARADSGDEGVWLHNALDVPGAYGETVRAVAAERVTRPVAAHGAGERSEYLRLSLFAYVHIRVGRDKDDQQFAGSPFEVVRDAAGAVTRVRIRRGARIEAGQPLGTLNKYNHVHLTLGAPGAEMNPLPTIAFPGLVDTVAPTIEAVSIESESREPLGETTSAKPIEARGRVRLLVNAWDRHDANPERRRLGPFRLGYQLLDAAGAPVAGFGDPRMTISFDRLPRDPRGGNFAYASGSRSWFTGPTVFVYEVTNTVRDGEAKEELLDLTPLAPGGYVIRIFAEDAFGNRTTRDVRITVPAPSVPAA